MSSVILSTAVCDHLPSRSRRCSVTSRLPPSPPSSSALLESLSLFAQLLAPLAPHISEELWTALGNEAAGTQMPWPGVSFQVPA